ncbi:rhamnogalacturonan lyase [Nonomuraea longispora]|uniref:Rhamnogalacturonan lyase n=1 Tax=Nonomuraea longispora TaxID=1848320 RepID=A0A4R4NDH6_9ACTN|nr:rhamnogalacturonan lyase [Nonomuraea longispora]TDC06384.1 rhamnogalacturonan lyase [Nonomuraea longispora]
MRPPSSIRRALITSLAALLCLPLMAAPASAAHGTGHESGHESGHGNGHGRPDAGVRLEHLDRGLVAATTGGGVFLSWRLLGDEVTGHGDTGMRGPAFRVYRDGRPIATVTDSTNHLDPAGTRVSEYRVAPVTRGREGRRSAAVKPWVKSFYDLKLRKPADGVTPAGEAFTYTANDMSVGDVDGDGRYEYVVKWDPSNSKDVSQRGYTGNTYVDTYELDGTLRWRLDLGVNIRSGAHYTQFQVYDLDGDGRSEMMLKTAPGTKIIRYGSRGQVVSERHVTMPRQDVRAGYSHQDDYRQSAADYFDHIVEMFAKWHERPEVVAKRWPATLEEAFGIEPAHEYPLSHEDAVELATYFVDVYAPGRSGNNRLREFEGFVLTGPEYLSVLDGATGRELQTIPYKPGRGDDGLMWGDYAMSRIEPGNRVDRFLSAVAYLDGRRPSAVFARGYYTRTTLVAYDWNGRRLEEVWYADSGHAPMANPFNASPHGVPGSNPEYADLTTQGFHSMSAADVDGDGRQEIVYGAATIDDDGDLLYSSFAEGPPQSSVPGQNVRLGHGDALHVGDFDPGRPGLEIWTVHEGGTWAPYGWALRDAATGEVIHGGYSGRDTGRGMVGDVDPAIRGMEAWSSVPPDEGIQAGLWSARGEHLDRVTPGTNMSIRWAADMTTQLVNGTATTELQTPTIDDWKRGTVLTAEGTLTNNWTKGNPGLVADVFGDWREELLVRTAGGDAVRIYLSTEVTGRKMYTLMHDPQYRADVARQQTAYNQPAYPSFYFGSDIDWSRVPVPRISTPKG